MTNEPGEVQIGSRDQQTVDAAAWEATVRRIGQVLVEGQPPDSELQRTLDSFRFRDETGQAWRFAASSWSAWDGQVWSASTPTGALTIEPFTFEPAAPAAEEVVTAVPEVEPAAAPSVALDAVPPAATPEVAAPEVAAPEVAAPVVFEFSAATTEPVSAPEPAASAPEPVVWAPEPVVWAPQPATQTPEPVATPTPITPTPAPMLQTRAPVAPVPVAATPAPIPAAPAWVPNAPAPSVAPASVPSMAAPSMAPAYRPTHAVPPSGMPAWAQPDPRVAPQAHLAPGLDVMIAEWLPTGWARIVCSNRWSGWVDGRLLVPYGQPFGYPR